MLWQNSKTLNTFMWNFTCMNKIMLLKACKDSRTLRTFNQNTDYQSHTSNSNLKLFSHHFGHFKEIMLTIMRNTNIYTYSHTKRSIITKILEAWVTWYHSGMGKGFSDVLFIANIRYSFLKRIWFVCIY